MGNVTFPGRVLVLGAQRHFVEDADDHLIGEQNTQDMVFVAGDYEVSHDRVICPAQFAQVALDAIYLGGHSDRMVSRQSDSPSI